MAGARLQTVLARSFRREDVDGRHKGDHDGRGDGQGPASKRRSPGRSGAKTWMVVTRATMTEERL
jgi:hypothetical protein